MLEAAENLSEVFKAHAGELETMRSLNEELRLAVEAARNPISESPVAEHPFPFGSRRPPGGDGDDETEERLFAEIDGEPNIATAPSSRRNSTPASGTSTPNRPRVASVSDTLRTTSLFIKKLQKSKASRVPLSRSGTIESSSGLSIDTASGLTLLSPPTMVGSSPLGPTSSETSVGTLNDSPVAMSRQGSLTFAEPILIGRTRSASNMGIISETSRVDHPPAEVEPLEPPDS